MRTVVLDCAGLSQAALSHPATHAVLTAAARKGARVVVPAVVLAEVLTGQARDAQVWHAVNRLVVEPIDRDIGGEAGPLRERALSARKKTRDLTVDAIVAAVARRYAPSIVLTCDDEDLALLCSGADVVVHHV